MKDAPWWSQRTEDRMDLNLSPKFARESGLKTIFLVRDEEDGQALVHYVPQEGDEYVVKVTLQEVAESKSPIQFIIDLYSKRFELN